MLIPGVWCVLCISKGCLLAPVCCCTHSWHHLVRWEFNRTGFNHSITGEHLQCRIAGLKWFIGLSCSLRCKGINTAFRTSGLCNRLPENLNTSFHTYFFLKHPKIKPFLIWKILRSPAPKLCRGTDFSKGSEANPYILMRAG